MTRSRLLGFLLIVLFFQSCQATPQREKVKNWFLSRSALLQDQLSIGMATALSRDGYFITLEHCLTRGDIHLKFRDEQGQQQKMVARLVSRVGKSEFVILKVDAAVQGYFQVSHFWDEGQTVYAGGRFLIDAIPSKRPDSCPYYSEGQIRKFHEGVFQHDALTVNGESGGPLINQEGQLLGLTSKVRRFYFLGMHLSWWDKYVALRPPFEEILNIIRADRKLHAS